MNQRTNEWLHKSSMERSEVTVTLMFKQDQRNETLSFISTRVQGHSTNSKNAPAVSWTGRTKD